MSIDPYVMFAEELSIAEDRIRQLLQPYENPTLQLGEVIQLTLQAGIQNFEDELRLQSQVLQNERPLPVSLYQEVLRARRERM